MKTWRQDNQVSCNFYSTNILSKEIYLLGYNLK